MVCNVFIKDISTINVALGYCICNDLLNVSIATSIYCLRKQLRLIN